MNEEEIKTFLRNFLGTNIEALANSQVDWTSLLEYMAMGRPSCKMSL
jgi:hypothetical protein